MSSRDRSTQISSIFRYSGKIKPSRHRLAFCALPWPRPGLVLSIPRNPLFSNTAESSLQIELVAPGQAWPQSSISASELPPQHHEVEFSLTHKINFLILLTHKRKFLSITGYWREISTFQRYREANMDFLRGRSPAYFCRGREEFTRRGFHVGKDCQIGPRIKFSAPVYLGDGCEVGGGATLGPRLLVGARSSIGEACGIQDVIVWPSSKIRKGSRLKEVIVTPFGKVKTG